MKTIYPSREVEKEQWDLLGHTCEGLNNIYNELGNPVA